MTDELRDYQARKELSVDAAGWCIVGLALAMIVGGFWWLLG